MMNRFKRWLCQHFLPSWAVDSLKSENRRLQTQLLESQAQVAKLEAYINGLEAAMRSRQRVIIHNNNGGGNKQ